MKIVKMLYRYQFHSVIGYASSILTIHLQDDAIVMTSRLDLSFVSPTCLVVASSSSGDS